MTEAEQMYRKVMLELLWARAVRPVSMDEEERFTGDLDGYWGQMTPKQQEEAELWFSSRNALSGPDTLPFLDVKPTVKGLPRRQG